MQHTSAKTLEGGRRIEIVNKEKEIVTVGVLAGK